MAAVALSFLARVVGNTIRNNKLSVVSVRLASQADISSNTIDGNGTDGIEVTQNSAVQLGAIAEQRCSLHLTSPALATQV